MTSLARILVLALLVVATFSEALDTSKESHNSTGFKTAETAKKMSKASRGDYHQYDSYYPHYYGGLTGHGGHHKELDHYLIPILILLGLGVLLMPVLSILMTGMAGNMPVTTLVSGRKRRDATDTTNSIFDLLTKVEKAFEVIKKLKEN